VLVLVLVLAFALVLVLVFRPACKAASAASGGVVAGDVPFAVAVAVPAAVAVVAAVAWALMKATAESVNVADKALRTAGCSIMAPS
jgi:hypothetical protein